MRENPELKYLSKEQFISTLKSAQTLPHFSPEELDSVRSQMSESEILEYYSLLYKFEDPETEKLDIDPDQILKPKKLYHASSSSQIKEFTPRAEKRRHDNEPAQVFATPSEAIASFFIVPTDDSFSISRSYDGHKTWVFIIGDMDRFKENDKGGSIYELPSDSFNSDPNLGLGLFEWTSLEPVIPINKVGHKSGLQTMMDLGVQVYQLPPTEFEKFKGSPNQAGLLAEMKPINPPTS